MEDLVYIQNYDLLLDLETWEVKLSDGSKYKFKERFHGQNVEKAINSFNKEYKKSSLLYGLSKRLYPLDPRLDKYKTESLKRLDEIKRSQMINKTRIQTRAKFERRKGYMTFRLNNVDKSQLMHDDILVITCTVGSNHYDDTIALQGFMKQLKQLIKMQRDHKLTEQIVIKCIQKIIDLSDLLINCTCDDYKYRLHYSASKFGYQYGDKETRPPNITNPKLEGCLCKHLSAVMVNKRWLTQVAADLNDFLNADTEATRAALKMNEDEIVFPSELARELGKKGAQAKATGDTRRARRDAEIDKQIADQKDNEENSEEQEPEILDRYRRNNNEESEENEEV